MTTNEDFLKTLFGSSPDVFTASVPSDPASADPGAFDYCHWARLSAENNNYFCVSEMTEKRRRLGNFVALRVLVVDDVGPKVDPDKVTEVLGTPTWVLQTSPKNYQYGYRLTEPVSDLAEANGLVDALCRTFGISDMAGVNRLVRLPVGVNHKKSLGVPYHTRLEDFRPQISLHPSIAKQVLRAVPTPIETVAEPFLPPEQDPVLIAMDLHGMTYEPTRDPGKYKVRCPWVADHTDGRDDGAAYFAPAGFKCHHGHCAHRTFADFREYLELSVGEVDQAKDDALFNSYLASEGLSLGDARREGQEEPAMSAGGRAAPTALPAREDGSVGRFFNPATGMPYKDGEPGAERFERRWVFNDVLLADGMWLLAGGGGLGKSRLALALCMSAATGLPLGEAFVPANPDGIRTLFITQEDDEAEKKHRLATQLELLATCDKRWVEPDRLELLKRNLYMPEIDPLDGISQSTMAWLAKTQELYGAYQFAVWDPLVMFTEGDQDINSPDGAKAVMRRLTRLTKRPARAQGLTSSVGFVHHLNKAGGVMGSEMFSNLSRMVFKLDKDPHAPPHSRQGLLEVIKCNGNELRGKVTTVKLIGKEAAVQLAEAFGEPAPLEPEPEPEKEKEKEKKPVARPRSVRAKRSR